MLCYLITPLVTVHCINGTLLDLYFLDLSPDNFVDTTIRLPKYTFPNSRLALRNQFILEELRINLYNLKRDTNCLAFRLETGHIRVLDIEQIGHLTR